MKTIFLTGGATGIGREIAQLFYKKGYNVSFIDINKTESDITTENWDDPRFLFYHGSVTNRDDINSAIEATVKKFDKIDTLIPNSGINIKGNILSTTDEELDLMLNTNLKGVINTIRAALPYIITNGGGSIVINVSDQAFIGKEDSFGYGITKGALGQMVKSLAIDYGKHGITVSGVCAGTIITPLAQNLLQKWADNEFDGEIDRAIEEEAKLYPVGRVGRADEVAEFFYFLANAPFVSGSLHLIDGGLIAG